MPGPVQLHDRPGSFWWSALAGTAIAAGLAVWVVVSWLSGSHTHRIVANNISRNFRACLITDQQDTTAAQSAWAGIQDAARSIPVNAQRLTVSSTTTAPLIPYVNSLVQRKCGLIISVDATLHAAVATSAQHNPHQQFLNTSQQPISLPNVRNLPEATRGAIGNIVRLAANKARRRA